MAEHFEKALKIANQIGSNIEPLKKVCDKHQIKPGHIVLGAGSLTLVAVVIIQGYSILCCLLTCVYPMYASI